MLSTVQYLESLTKTWQFFENSDALMIFYAIILNYDNTNNKTSQFWKRSPNFFIEKD